MSKLKAATRNKLPKSDFGPANAKARATQMVKKGKLSSGGSAKIKAKANRDLGKNGK
jgi:hypothetical protein